MACIWRLAMIVCMLGICCAHADNAPADILNFSDGSIMSGELLLTPGKKLVVISNKKRFEWELSELSAIEFIPVKKTLEYKWHFVEEGKTKKEKSKTPYPLIELEVKVVLRSGKVMNGTMQTTVFYLQKGDTSKRIIFRSKLKGREGDSLKSLVHLKSIQFAAAAPQKDSVKIELASGGSLMDFRAFRLPELDKVPLIKDGAGYKVDSMSGLIFSAMTKNSAYCYYPAEYFSATAPVLDKAVREAVAKARDFFDIKEILAVRSLASEESVYVFLKLVRGRKSTLKTKVNIPWQLNVWKFKVDEDDPERALFSGRAVLLRSKVATPDDIPPIKLVEFDPVKSGSGKTFMIKD